MARRQLSRPAANFALDRYLKRSDELPTSLTGESLFGEDRPLELEIGSGKGLFLETASGRRPDHLFLGVEIAQAYAAHAAARLAKSERTNAMMVAGDAEPLLQRSIPDGSLEAVHVYFPDPWWKKKHKKRRVVNPTSVRHIHRTLVPGGSFHFWTDVLEYFESAIEMIAAELPEFGPPIPEEPETEGLDVGDKTAGESYRTHFDRRSRLHRIPVYRVRYVKWRLPPGENDNTTAEVAAATGLV
ncbi:MAG: tRNA (guanosine(46)-N7)-methyltransferase TrmB [Planctomycetaceae bacterium]|nr:MAG: tRNA (guanosine(46)-N7)-methyltransferase TrmB [Planctomycetaceae bacterium]